VGGHLFEGQLVLVCDGLFGVLPRGANYESSLGNLSLEEFKEELKFIRVNLIRRTKKFRVSLRLNIY
jgi:hypothetical protein